MEKARLKKKESKLKILGPYSNSHNISTILGFDFIFENAGTKVIRGINPNFIYCNMPLEIIINYKDKRLFYNLVLDDLDKDNADVVHDIVNLPNNFMTTERLLEEIFENEIFNNGDSLLDYILKNNFILFESTGSYPVDEVYSKTLKEIYLDFNF